MSTGADGRAPVAAVGVDAAIVAMGATVRRRMKETNVILAAILRFVSVSCRGS
jgi:hypothetical protein